MVSLEAKPTNPALNGLLERVQSGGALLPDTPENLLEVVGILKSYGIVLGAYWRNLTYIADHQFLVLFPFFKYFNGDVTTQKLLRHWWHDRINYEFAEYCMKAMFWHGGGGLDAYLDTPEFEQNAKAAIQAKVKSNPLMSGLNGLMPNFLVEQVRQLCFYSGLGQFWEVMSDMFLKLSDRYDQGEIRSIADVVEHVKQGLVNAAAKPITYTVEIKGKSYDIIPKSAGLTFLVDTALPYVEAVFLRSFPFFGTVSYNAQANQISPEQGDFNYGALFADPLPVGGAGIPPTLLMQDMRHFIPDYLHRFYQQKGRGEDDLRVKICVSFQKSMFCVTTATVFGLMPHPLDTTNPAEQEANRAHIMAWLKRLEDSRLLWIQTA
ncbi:MULTISPECIES: CO2 hydration protein [unclassified Leptolyngbya]|uniref:CO2 hydration protein n=1 Tax=unclassified Leptolyngbya TaxID=2650499 RepID=UPI001684E2E3|nr:MULTISPECIES: CO2 hydration protein [unclassified Leptolyngbya]MBD1912129.1 CO2 hydration protein [Leptolyngbya sp. FACHB-8]MBD2155020.1 CO2 hydration protein [Leptolyngbya sp. FACHB-16]